MNKVILLDSSVFVHQSIFSWGSVFKKIQDKILPDKTFLPPVGYSYFSSIISTLKKIGVDKDDLIIVGQDGRDSWRKDYYANYKAQRQAFRESFEHINWSQKYEEIGKIIDQLKESSPFIFIQIPKIEFDDICGVACKYFIDKEIIIVSSDKDLEQLSFYNNVKIFSTYAKYKGQKGAYKIVKNPLKIIKDKCEKGDISDNILVSKEDTIHDYELREFIINLIKLPEFVEKTVIKYLENLTPKELIQNKLPFQNSLAKKFITIYNSTNKIDYEECKIYNEKRQIRLKNKEKKTRLLKKQQKEMTLR